MTPWQKIIDAHCDEHGGVLPTDPREWLEQLVRRAYIHGKHGRGGSLVKGRVDSESDRTLKLGRTG